MSVASTVRSTFTVAMAVALIAGLLTAGVSGAQSPDEPETVELDRTIHLQTRLLDDPGIDEALAIELAEQAQHVIVQFESPRSAVDDELARGVIDVGGQDQALAIDLLGYLGGLHGIGTAYLARVEVLGPGAPDDPGARVRGLQRLIADDKLSPELRSLIGDGVVEEVRVRFFDGVGTGEAAEVLDRAGVFGRAVGPQLWEVEASPEQVAALAEEDPVQWLDPVTEPLDLLDDVRDRSSVDAVHDLDTATGVYGGLSGSGVRIGIMDSGVDETHDDFAGRIVRLHPDPQTHGSHVAGIAAGSGVRSDQTDDGGNPNGGTPFQWRGVAPEAEIAAYGYLGGDLPAFHEAVNIDGIDVSNHSYVKNGVQGLYNTNAQTIDWIVRGIPIFNLPPRPAVWAAGNQGHATRSGPDDCETTPPGGLYPQYPNPENCPTAFQAGYFSILTPCKNCLHVGNLRKNGTMSSGSSLGPTMDGRLKPDVVAVGSSVRAVRSSNATDSDDNLLPGNGYRTGGGTSMAAPAVTGVIALMLEQYADTFGAAEPPLPSTSKAVLAQTATSLSGTAGPSVNFDTGTQTTYGPGPDWATGFGLVNATAAVGMVRDRRFVEGEVTPGSHTDEHPVAVLPGQTQLRVTLAWDDLPGTPNANAIVPQLVNDLDLTLVSPSGETFLPLVLPIPVPNDCDPNTPVVEVGTCFGQDDPDQDYLGPAAPGVDRRNNVEQVVVSDPSGLEPGTWTAEVSVLNPDGMTVRMPFGGTQRYSLAGVTADRADLSISMDAPAVAVAGEDLTYELTITNTGPDAATGVAVLDLLPDELSYVGGAPNCVVGPDDELFCPLGDLAAGATADLTIVAHAPHDLVYDAGGPVTLTNTATVYSTVPDPDTSNTTATADTTFVAVGDLEVVSTQVSGAPAEALIGEDLPLTVTTRIRNDGPSWPMDTTFSIEATASAGGTVDPTVESRTEPALAPSLRTVSDDFTVRCDEPGEQTFTFTASLVPLHADETDPLADTDPDPSKAVDQVDVTVECIVPIVINVRPGNPHNQINPASPGAVPVAALTTEAGEYGLPVAFDATTIQPGTVRFGAADEVWSQSGGAPIHGKAHIRDAHELDDKTKDGDLDMVMHFRMSLTGLAPGDTEACMRGLYEDGGQQFAFFGCDIITTIPPVPT